MIVVVKTILKRTKIWAQTLVCALSLVCVAPLSAQEIAITLDDLPYALSSRTTPQEGLTIVQDINAVLATHSIIATGFAVGNQITTKSAPALEAFANAGHQVANHSWSHADYDTLSTRQFRRETKRTDKALSNWLSEPKYYRFPYLREGESERTRRAADKVLSKLGYRNVPATIDNDEWKFNQDYLDAIERGDTKSAQAIAARYIEHMKERSLHFRKLARDAFGRDVKHILLLHMNRINADHLGTLLAWYKAKGWRFITVDDAMTDLLFSAQERYEGARGLSQIERVIGRASP